MTWFRIPLVATPQTMSIQLGVVGYKLVTRWNRSLRVWVMDIYDVNANLIAGGIALVTGADLLEQLQYLGIAGQLGVYDSQGPPDALPTFTNLGATANLYFQPTP